MEKTEFLEKLKALTTKEEVLTVNREVNELKTQFEDFVLEEERQRQVAFLEAEKEGQTFETNIPDAIRDEFYEIWNVFKEKRNEILTQQKEEQNHNYAVKSSLLERLRNLIENEENIKTSYDVSKEIHEKWIATGEVAREKRQEIQGEYTRLRDMFFSNLAIFKELREYDLKRNQQIKEEIIEKVIALKSENSIKQVEDTLKTLQNEFDETGPVPREEWERVRDTYWDNVREVYKKIHDFYDEKRSQLQENTTKKAALLEKVKTFVEKNTQLDTAKAWDLATKELIAFQEEWKNIGYGLKKQNEELWEELRANCDVFFENKRKFYENLKGIFAENASKKQALITQIEALKENTDWQVTTKKIIQLQDKWRKIGHAGQKLEQQLWKDFRSACDYYFNAKDAYYKELDAVAVENLKAKQTIIAAIKEFQPTEDKKEVLEHLKNFATAFNAIGKVPFKEKDTVYNEFKNALDAHYGKLKLEGEEKEKVLFQVQLSNLKAAPNSSELIERTRRDFQTQIQTLKQAVIQYENNLGFFSNASASNPIIAEINQKIEATKNKIEQLKLKINLLNE